MRRVALEPGDSVSRARRASTVETTTLASTENAITPMPMPSECTSAPLDSRRTDSKTMTPAPTRMSIASIAAARFSNLSWP